MLLTNLQKTIVALNNY